MNPLPETRGNKLAIAICCYVLITIRFAEAQCIASGPNSPASSSSVSFAGSDYSFNNPANCLASDNNRSTASSLVTLFYGKTQYLQATDFGFSIPTAATICGIEVHIEKSATNLLLNITSVKDNSVRILKNGIRTGTNLAQTNVPWSADNDSSYTYGGNNALWGTPWTPADINSNKFGVAISADIIGIAGLLPAARIDHISITVYYLNPNVLPVQSIQFNVSQGSNNSAMLSWITAPIDQNTIFTVERSANGTTWKTVNASIQKGAFSSAHTMCDAKPLPGKSYYRLKMTTASGEERYSIVQPFELTAVPSLKCYPNPSTSSIQVTGVMPGERVSVTDRFGHQLYLSPPAVNTAVSIDIDDLQPGMYVISAGKRKLKVLKM